MSPHAAWLHDADFPAIEIDDPIDVCAARNRRAIVLFGDEPGRRRVRELLAGVHNVSCPPGNNFFAYLGRVTNKCGTGLEPEHLDDPDGTPITQALTRPGSSVWRDSSVRSRPDTPPESTRPAGQPRCRDTTSDGSTCSSRRRRCSTQSIAPIARATSGRPEGLGPGCRWAASSRSATRIFSCGPARQ